MTRDEEDEALFATEMALKVQMGLLKVQEWPRERRFERFQNIGCIACFKRGWFRHADVHHLLSGNRRRGDEFTIPLCPWHHRGVNDCPTVVKKLGPSLAHGSKPFREEFGTDEELLAETNRLLAEIA